MNAVQKKYKYAVIATDVVIFTVKENELKVLLIKMNKKPFLDKWAMPGGLIKPDEGIDGAAQRILLEKTGVKNVYLEQFSAFGKVDRDPFGRVVSVAYFALISPEKITLETPTEQSTLTWFSVSNIPPLAYDHKAILAKALSQLRERLAYSNIAYSLLPKSFTLTDLQRVYEGILGEALDKRNFRKKILSLAVVKPTGKKQRGNANRPAALYTFTKRKPHMVKILDQ